MNSSIAPTIRQKAIWCYLAGLAWIPAFSILSIETFAGKLIFPALLWWTIGALLLSPLPPILLWLSTRHSHPFVNLSGKSAINLNLTFFSQVFVLIFSAVLIGLIAYLVAQNTDVGPGCTAMRDSARDNLLSEWLQIPFYIWLSLILFAILNQIVVTIKSAIAAKKGQQYVSSIVIKFL
jgi:uncharacterized Tic20 family protein